MTKFNSRLPELAALLHQNAAGLTRKTAEGIRDTAAANAPVDKGELRDSYQVEMVDETTVIVGSDCDHALPVEYGTSEQPAQPHFIPAAEAARAEFEAGLKTLLK